MRGAPKRIWIVRRKGMERAVRKRERMMCYVEITVSLNQVETIRSATEDLQKLLRSAAIHHSASSQSLPCSFVPSWPPWSLSQQQAGSINNTQSDTQQPELVPGGVWAPGPQRELGSANRTLRGGRRKRRNCCLLLLWEGAQWAWWTWKREFERCRSYLTLLLGQ